MPDRIQHLKILLRELESELADVQTLDPETREMLEEVSGEIQGILSKNRKQGEEAGVVSGRLRNAIEQFESSHPTLTGVLARLADALAQMGI